jgi:hypothetical protein
MPTLPLPLPLEIKADAWGGKEEWKDKKKLWGQHMKEKPK